MIRKTVKVRSDIRSIGRAPGFVQEFCEENAILDSIAAQLCVVLDEILPSIASISTSPRICLEIVKNDQTVDFIISQSSEQYDLSDPQALLWPDNAADTRISDLSMQIIHKIMDKIECSYEAGVNTTRLVKSL